MNDKFDSFCIIKFKLFDEIQNTSTISDLFSALLLFKPIYFGINLLDENFKKNLIYLN